MSDFTFIEGDRVRWYDEDQGRLNEVMGLPYDGTFGTITTLYDVDAVVHWEDTDTSTPVPLDELEPAEVGDTG